MADGRLWMLDLGFARRIRFSPITAHRRLFLRSCVLGLVVLRLLPAVSQVFGLSSSRLLSFEEQRKGKDDGRRLATCFLLLASSEFRGLRMGDVVGCWGHGNERTQCEAGDDHRGWIRRAGLCAGFGG